MAAPPALRLADVGRMMKSPFNYRARFPNREVLMRFGLVLALGALIIGPATAQAQHWTPEEQEVIDQLKECWTVWVEGIRQGEDLWLDQCADDFSYWGDNGSPSTPAFNQRNFQNLPDMDWLELYPLMVRVYDDIAIIQFFGRWRVEYPDGPEVEERKRTEVFRKVNGRWLLIAGHSGATEE